MIPVENLGAAMDVYRMEFNESENPWAPTAAVAEINARTGSRLELIGLDEQTGGTSSAAYVRWPDGRECALTRTTIPIDWMRRTAEVLSALRAEGLPVPRHDLVMELSDGRLAVLQERLPGRPLKRVESIDIDAMVTANDQFADVLANRRDLPELPRVMHHSVDDRVKCKTLETYSNRSRRLLEQIQEIVRVSPQDMPGGGLVHPDFGLGNVLFDESRRVTGVVDWNGGATAGDHRFALMKLSLNMAAEGEVYGVQSESRERLDAIMKTIEPELLRLYWAQWTLCNVFHAIDNGFPTQRVEEELTLGENRLY
jgi:aminoglycoside phosphotransferase (APT) family kinase protein